MARNTNWIEDSEALGIAMRLVDKFSELFKGLNLSKIKFVRELSSNGKKIGELKPCDFPYYIDCPYAYYIIISNTRWKELSKGQHNMTIKSLLYSIADGGTDENSKNYAKTRPYDVQGYTKIISDAGGNYNWQRPGMDVPDPLDDNRQEEDK